VPHIVGNRWPRLKGDVLAVVLIAEAKALAMVVKNVRARKRITRLAERLAAG
jgi:hypothetical protein